MTYMGGPLGRPYFKGNMASNAPELERLKVANRQVRECLRDCDELLERTEFMLKRSRQDNRRPTR